MISAVSTWLNAELAMLKRASFLMVVSSASIEYVSSQAACSYIGSGRVTGDTNTLARNIRAAPCPIKYACFPGAAAVVWVTKKNGT